MRLIVNQGTWVTGISLLAGVLLTAGLSFAGPPVLFQTCPDVKYKAGQGALIFDDSCKAAYLLPGPIGLIEVTGSFSSISDSKCAAVAAAESAALGAFGDTAARATKKKEIQEQRDKLADQTADLDNQKLPLEQVKVGVSQARDRSSAAALKIEMQFLNDCESDATKSFACFSLQSDLKKQQNLAAETADQLTKVDALLKQVYDQLASIKLQDDSLKADYDKLDKGASTPSEQVAAEKVLSELRQQQGATISATQTTPLSTELKAVRDANTGKDIQIQAMRFIGGSIHAAGIDKTNTPQLLGSATIVLPGQQEMTEDGSLFINASGAQIVLDTVAACQLFAYKDPSNLSPKDMAKRVAANLVAKAYLRYTALLSVTVTVSMDYSKFYELLVSTESKNGFFKTSTIRSVVEKMRGDSSLSVVIVDEGNVLSAEQKDALQSAMRDRVVQRALDYLNPKYVGVDPNAKPGEPTAGAGQLATSLRKCPNQWCQVGAVVVDVANSIFGGSASRQSFVQSLGVNSTETYKNTDTIDLVTDFAFQIR